MIGARIGQLVITHQLGEGGMGAVYAAEHEVLRTRRAIKVLLPEWTQNAMVVQRFVNEARAAASIHHRNIIAIHDCGQLAGGRWYIVMDHLEGSTLARFQAAQGGPLSIHLALELLASIANGLEAAHAASIVHRDLKPDNIFLVRHDTNARHPVILDFGIAKLGEGDAAGLTRTGMSAGTPAYMATEQIRDMKVVDRRSDVYALGLIAYEIITGGWLPYQAPSERETYRQLSAAELYYRQLSHEPIDPRQHVPAIPARWAAAILSAIHPEPSRRPHSPRAFVLALAEATPGHGALLDGMAIVRTYAHELQESGRPRESVHAPPPEGTVPASRRRILTDATGTPSGAAASVARSHGMLVDGDGSRAKRRRRLAIFASSVVAGGVLVLALDREPERRGPSRSSVGERDPALAADPSVPDPARAPTAARVSRTEASSEPAPRMAPPPQESEASVTSVPNPAAREIAPTNPAARETAPTNPAARETAPANPAARETAPTNPAARETAPVTPVRPPGGSSQAGVPRVTASSSPDPARAAAAPLAADAAETGDSLVNEWRAVQAVIIALQESRGRQAVDPLFTRWRRINILAAMATAESRRAAARELAEIRRGLAER